MPKSDAVKERMLETTYAGSLAAVLRGRANAHYLSVMLDRLLDDWRDRELLFCGHCCPDQTGGGTLGVICSERFDKKVLRGKISYVSRKPFLSLHSIHSNFPPLFYFIFHMIIISEWQA